jgi:integrase
MAKHTVDWCLEYYWNEHVLRSVVDKERIKYCILALRSFLGRKNVSTLLPKDCRDYEKRRARATVKTGTIRRELSCLASALLFCHRDGMIEGMPKLWLPVKPPALDKWLTKGEADKLIECAGPRARLFIRIALATGGRPEAIDALTWAQVDLVNRKIHFGLPGENVTKKRRPVVPISDALYPVLIEAQAKAATKHVLGHAGSTRKCFELARGKAGLPWCTRKTLRHTFATWAAQAGVDLWAIAGILGDTVATVEKNYAHHDPDHLRKAVNF